MTAPSLDTLVARARAVGIRPGPGAACVAEVERLARLVPEPRARWLVPVLAGVALAASGAAVIAVATRPGAPAAGAAAPVWVGERVAVLPERAAGYRVAEATGDRTTIEVDHGAVTVRLLPDRAPHRLILRGGGVEAVATGTIYTLAIDEQIDRGVQVRVHEGTVHVTGRQVGVVDAGGTWFRRRDGSEGVEPSGRARSLGERAAERLLALSPVATHQDVAPPAVAPVMVIAPGSTDGERTTGAAPTPAHPGGNDARPPPARRPDPAAADDDTSPEARWRHARLLRGQGKPDAARALLLAISADGDATWAPLAHIEAVRIDLEDLGAPEHALDLAERMLARWPDHALVTEVRTLRCRALGLLGRGAECDRRDAGN